MTIWRHFTPISISGMLWMLHKLSFVAKQPEGGDVFTFFFRRPPSLTYTAGQHAIFFLSGFYRPHPFSMSSAPDEERLAVTTHTGTGSRYKRRLLTLEPDDTIWCTGPLMNFTLRQDASRHVFLAQGIGISPFRSMLMDVQTRALEVDVTLVHVTNDPPVFRDLTESSVTQAHYPTDAAAFRDIVATLDIAQHFYLSGSPRFVRTTKAFLRSRGVNATSIITDSFLGY